MSTTTEKRPTPWRDWGSRTRVEVRRNRKQGRLCQDCRQEIEVGEWYERGALPPGGDTGYDAFMRREVHPSCPDYWLQYEERAANEKRHPGTVFEEVA